MQLQIANSLALVSPPQLGWKGRKLAWLAILALSTVIIAFFGVTFVVNNSLHIFNVR